MEIFRTLKSKVLIFILIATLLPIIVSSILIYNSAKNSILLTRKEFLQSVQNVQYNNIVKYMANVIKTTEAMQFSDIILSSNITNLMLNKLSPEYKSTLHSLNSFLRPIQRKEKYSDIFILDNKGKILYSSDPSYSWKYMGKSIDSIFPVKISYQNNAVQFSNIFSDTTKDAYYNFMSIAPLISDAGMKIGYIAIEQTMIPIYKIINTNANLTNTGESILLHEKNLDYFLASPLRNDPNTKINSKIEFKKTQDGENILDVNGRKVLAVSTIIPESYWYLVTKIDTQEIFHNIIKLRNITFLIVAILALLTALFSYLIATHITKPIIKLADFAKNIVKKDFSLLIDQKLLNENDEIGLLANSFNYMQSSLKTYYDALNIKIGELEEANTKIHKSIVYGSIIQSSMLPDYERIQEVFADSFFIWEPRDIVGGDIYSIMPAKDGFIVALADCTGHGIPGALLTMLFTSTFAQIIATEGVYYPDQILKRLNMDIKKLLKQDLQETKSDDGLDVAICAINTKKKKLYFSGAKLSLFCVENNELHIFDADKQNIGYKRSKVEYEFTRHELTYSKDTAFYITTDGMLDQLSDDAAPRAFGKKAFCELIMQNFKKPMQEQKDAILKTFSLHKGSHVQLDDMAVIGFKIREEP